MESIVLITIMLVCVLILAVNVLFFLTVKRKIAAFERNFNDFITPPRDGEKSGLDDLITNLSWNIGHSAFTQVRSMMASSESADARARKAVDGAVSEDLLSAANPVLASLLDSMPALKKIIRKNPALADYAVDRLMKGNSSVKQVESGGNGYSGTTIDIT